MVRQRRWCVVLLSADERQFRPRGVIFEHTQVKLRGSRLLVYYGEVLAEKAGIVILADHIMDRHALWKLFFFLIRVCQQKV